MIFIVFYTKTQRIKKGALRFTHDRKGRTISCLEYHGNTMVYYSMCYRLPYKICVAHVLLCLFGADEEKDAIAT